MASGSLWHYFELPQSWESATVAGGKEIVDKLRQRKKLKRQQPVIVPFPLSIPRLKADLARTTYA